MTEMRRSMSQSGSAATLAKPHIVGIEPMVFKSGGGEPFTITGSGFKRGCVVVFQLKSDPKNKVEVEPDSVTETKIKGTAKPMAVGATLVWVQNPSGEDSNQPEVKVVP